jgi:hypothetical protein
VFASRKWTRIALALNVAGTILLFYSFQATSSSFRLISRSQPSVMGKYTEYAICVKDFTLLETNGHGVGIGHFGCPTSEDDRPAAVVNTEHPRFITLGFLMIVVGFIIQYFAVPEPKSIVQLRKEIKMLKMREEADS